MSQLLGASDMSGLPRLDRCSSCEVISEVVCESERRCWDPPPRGGGSEQRFG